MSDSSAPSPQPDKGPDEDAVAGVETGTHGPEDKRGLPPSARGETVSTTMSAEQSEGRREAEAASPLEKMTTAEFEHNIRRKNRGYTETAPLERLDSLFESDLEELGRHARVRRTSLEAVNAVLEAVLSGDPHVTPHERVMDATGMGFHDARKAMSVLSDIGDVHEAYDRDDDWSLHWVRCDQFIVDKCEQRRISLLRYFQMKDLLEEFQDRCVGWYVRRNRRQSQPFKLSDLKAEYVGKVQERFFPDKPVKARLDDGESAPAGKEVHTEEYEGVTTRYYIPDDPRDGDWSRHIAARYVRTAQDSIIRSYDLSY